MEKINFDNKYKKFSDYWSPKVIAEINDYQFKLVKIQGHFIWHSHEHSDEAFIVIEGSMEIHLENRVVTLEKDEMFVVEKGIEHRPFAKDECKIMIVEPKDIVNTGNKKSLLTSGNDVWI